jgi:hypothetical protein
MRRILLIATLKLFASSIYCQKNNFKNRIWKKQKQGNLKLNQDKL